MVYSTLRQQIAEDFFTPKEALLSAEFGDYASMRRILYECKNAGIISKKDERKIFNAYHNALKEISQDKRETLKEVLEVARGADLYPDSKNEMESLLDQADYESRKLGFPLAGRVKEKIRNIHKRNLE